MKEFDTQNDYIDDFISTFPELNLSECGWESSNNLDIVTLQVHLEINSDAPSFIPNKITNYINTHSVSNQSNVGIDIQDNMITLVFKYSIY